MPALTKQTECWRDCAFLTLTEAAKAAGRSYSWARDCAVDGRLDRRRPGGSGPILITAASLARLLDRDRFPTLRAHVEKKQRRHLRLVADNTQ